MIGKSVSDIVCDDADIRELFNDFALMQTAQPSPFFPPTPLQLRRWQRWKNAHLKRLLILKRRYQQPIKPLPLP